MNDLARVAKGGLIAYALSALAPVKTSDAWWIRIWDFPRLQLLTVGLGFGWLYLRFGKDTRIQRRAWSSLWAIGLGLDLRRVLPYTRLWSVQSRSAEINAPERRLSILMANIRQDNRHCEKLLRLIGQRRPDLILLAEVNQRWLAALARLENDYKYQLTKPQENTYGIAFYSKLPLQSAEIRYLIESAIPSIRARVVLRSGDCVEIFGLHPRPPRQKAERTTERDAELVQTAFFAARSPDPVIVMGDLNDVAWSHTTRRFQRISGLLDPRVGRGSFATFPVQYPFFRFPLDYLFHSESLRLVAIERLPAIGSDHFPMYAELSLEPAETTGQSGPSTESGDMQEARATIRKAHRGTS